MIFVDDETDNKKMEDEEETKPKSKKSKNAFKCDECGKLLSRKDALARHKLLHLKEEETEEVDIREKVEELKEEHRKIRAEMELMRTNLIAIQVEILKLDVALKD